MSFRNLDNNHDWVYGNGKSAYTHLTREIALDIETALLSFYQDCFFDLDAGVDWWHLLEYNQQEKLEQQVRQTIASREGVTKINSVDVVLTSGRVLTAIYNIDTVYTQDYSGEVVIQ